MTRSRAVIAAWIIVGALFIGILADVARHPASHTTMPTYRLASSQWWVGADPYTQRQHDAFLYFPQAAVFFTPFNLPGFAGDLLWRAFTFGLFLYALVRLRGFFLGDNRTYRTDRTYRTKDSGNDFLVLCLLAAPSSMASLRNAQFDLPLAALIVLTAAEVSAARWIAAAAWLCLAVALKPLAVVPLLMFGALFWRTIPRLAIGLLVIAVLPFLHWNPSFVAHEYQRCFETLGWASQGDEPRYSDLAALLSKFGWDVPFAVKTVGRAVFALVYFGLGALAVRRLDRIGAAWAVGALSADYLMLFNPRTETCSYVFLGPFIASLAILYSREAGRKWLAWLLGIGAIGLACDAFPRLGSLSIHDLTDRWFKPLIALLFLPVVVEFISHKRAQGTQKD